MRKSNALAIMDANANTHLFENNISTKEKASSPQYSYTKLLADLKTLHVDYGTCDKGLQGILYSFLTVLIFLVNRNS